MTSTPQAADARALEEAAKAAFRKAQSVYRADHDHFPIVKTWESTAESVREGWRKIAYAAVESARENGPAKPNYRALLEMAVEALEFYARKANWTWDIAPDPAGTPIPGTSPVEGDYGNMARATITTIKAELEGK